MAVRRSTPQDGKLPYLPGLDGLRALSVIAVLFYHADMPWMPGGFLGVEAFFVISGYLITSLLLQEWQERSRVDFKAFWLRRARRLLPAVYLLIVATLAYAVLFLPREVSGLRLDALASFGYVTNWYLVVVHKSYFETVGRPPMLRHLWSLAIEEQFYLLWPLVFAFGMRFLRRYRMLFTVVVGLLASTALMAALYVPNTDPSRIYYGTDTRAASLLTGAALAFIWVPRPRARRTNWVQALPLNFLGLLALGILVWSFFGLDEFSPFLYQGGFLLVSLATAAAIAVVVHPQAQMGPILLGWQPLRWIGLRSYSIYLWHWPLFVVTRPQLDVPIDGWLLLALRLVGAGILAELSYRYVETPFRQGAFGRAWRSLREAYRARRWWSSPQWAGVGLVLTCFVVLGISVASVPPPPPPSYLNFEATHITAPQQAANPTPPDVPTEGADLAGILSLTPMPSWSGGLLPAATPTPANPAEGLPTESLETPAAAPMSTNTPLQVGQVTAIGDSVMLGAAYQLEESIGNVEVDAAVGRQVADATKLLQTRQASGRLADVVVLHLGSNGTFTAEQFDEIMRILGDTRRVVFLNVKVPRRWEAPNNVVLDEGVKRHKNARLVDWHDTATKRPEIFGDDGIHLLPEGARLYTETIINALKAP